MSEIKQDIKRECLSCGVEFVINVAEQEFYNTKKLILPKRCKQCRASRKAASRDLNDRFWNIKVRHFGH